MRIAYSKRRDSHIIADDAKSEDAPFLCMNPDCRRPVTLHRTSPHYHFQHSRGKGSPDCFLFVGRLESEIQAITPIKTPATSGPQRSSSPSLLFSGDTPDDFSLTIRLPDVDPERPWVGCIVVHERGERRAQFERIRYGVSGLRPQALYLLECRGDIEPGYKALVQGATVGLNQVVNVFPYSIGGAALLESDRPLRCATQYWVITRESMTLPADCEPVHFYTQPWQSWWVSRLEIPAFATLSTRQITVMESWLRRPLRRESSRVIIRAPTPHHFFDTGVPVFPVETESLTIEATAFEELRLELNGVEQATPDALGTAGLYVCRLGRLGRWTLFSKSRRLLEWEVADCPTFSPPSIVLVSKESQIDLFHPDAAAFISNSAARQEKIQLRVGNSRLLAIVAINGDSTHDDPSADALPLDSQSIRSISAGNFGSVEISTVERGAGAFDGKLLASLAGGIRWLQGLSTVANDRDTIRMSGHPSHDAPRWIKSLASAHWSGRLLPQIRLMERNLHDAGVWHVR